MTTDERWMRRALRLAARARGRTAPNPMVGAVVVSDGRVVGEGWHHRAGEPHAEVLAFAQAGTAAAGGTLYVTLEPCCHYGRTPPCTQGVLASGVQRVVMAMLDPFPKVAGGGHRLLREAGLEVESGVLENEARTLNRGYLQAVEHQRPWFTLKIAMTLDGKIATRTGDSRWVTGEAARRHVHRLRNWNDAVLIGSGTALADDPQLTARLPGGRNPVRVVVDTRGRLTGRSVLAATACDVRTLVAVGPDVDGTSLERCGVEVLHLPLRGRHVDLVVLARALASRGLHSVLCEGGALLGGALMDAGLVDEVVWFVAPKLVGGIEAPGPLGGGGVEKMNDALRLDQMRVRRFGEDLAVSGYVHRDH